MRTSRWIGAPATALVLSAPALASGIAVYEQGTKASGQAGAWVARADDASAVWYNPATLVRQEGFQAQIGVNAASIGADSFTLTDDAFPQFPPGQRFEAENNPSYPFHLYVAQRVSDRLAWGIGLNNPFGFLTEWTERPVTFSARRSELVTYNLNPNVAWRLGENWSVAVGLDYLVADVKEFSRDFHQDFDNDRVVDPGEEVGRKDLTGDGNDLGWNLGVHYAAKEWALGIAYRSGMSPEVEGDVDFSGFGPIASLFVPDRPATARFDLPAHGAVGVAWSAAAVWQFEFDLSWTQWSSFKEIAIDVTGEQPPFVADETIRQDWDNTIAYRFGASWQFAEAHQLRLGAAQDENPIRDNRVRPSIPDGDRWALSVGYGYQGATWAFDVYYMPVWFRDRQVRGADPAETVLEGDYKASGQALGAGVNVRF